VGASTRGGQVKEGRSREKKEEVAQTRLRFMGQVIHGELASHSKGIVSLLMNMTPMLPTSHSTTCA